MHSVAEGYAKASLTGIPLFRPGSEKGKVKFRSQRSDRETCTGFRLLHHNQSRELGAFV